MSKTPSNFRARLAESAFARRADQTIIAAAIFAAVIGVGVWWLRHGGAAGRLVDHDQLPSQRIEYVVDVNRASVAELAELPGVGGTLALRIVEHRETNGPFRSLADLSRVKGIGEKTLEALTPQVKFE